MAHSQPASAAKPTKNQAVATKPVHVGLISHIRTGIFNSLHVHASHAIDNAAVNTNDLSIYSDPIVAHIITDLEKMIEKKLAAYEATQRSHVVTAQAAAKAAEPVEVAAKAVKPVEVAVVCPNCSIKSHTVDLSHSAEVAPHVTTHPNSPELEHTIVHSLPMEIEHGAVSGEHS